jgi:putative addiction module killer protein
MQIRVEEYICKDESNPYREWFDALDVHAAAKITTALVRMALGNLSNVKWFDGIGEYRIDWGPGYRIYLAKDGELLVILFGGGVKKTQSADIKRAKAFHQEYKSRKKNNKSRVTIVLHTVKDSKGK